LFRIVVIGCAFVIVVVVVVVRASFAIFTATTTVTAHDVSRACYWIGAAYRRTFGHGSWYCDEGRIGALNFWPPFDLLGLVMVLVSLENTNSILSPAR
jgi:hypothetical protein